MSENRVQKYSNDFLKRYGINLATSLDSGEANNVHAFFYRIEMMIFEEIKMRNPSFDPKRITENEYKAIWRALLEQGYYIHSNYDFNIFTGIDPVNGTTISIEEIRKRALSPLVRIILENAGLFFRGIVSRGKFGREVNYYTAQVETV